MSLCGDAHPALIVRHSTNVPTIQCDLNYTIQHSLKAMLAACLRDKSSTAKINSTDAETDTNDDVFGIEESLRALMSGQVSAAQSGAFIALLATRLPYDSRTLVACSRVMLSLATKLHARDIASNEVLLDVVGTGGDGFDTFNVSTSAALVAAAAGIKVLKHGNKAVTSKCGSADFLVGLGVNLENMNPRHLEQVVSECGFAFVFAPAVHPSLKHVQPVRKALGIRTAFNVLGPLTNPALPSRQVSGVYLRELGPVYAECLKQLGVEKALIVHGSEGLDEISPAGLTYAWYLDQGIITPMTLTPEESFGLPRHSLSQLPGDGSRDENVAIFRKLSNPRSHPLKEPAMIAAFDFLLMNAAAALWIGGKATSLKEGLAIARSTIMEGRLQAIVEAYAAASHKSASKQQNSILDVIVAQRRIDISIDVEREAETRSEWIRSLAQPPHIVVDIVSRLRANMSETSIMAEFKRASPSKGLINGDVSIADQVKAYAIGGASVISVLCEPNWFRGSIDDLSIAAQTLDDISKDLSAPRPALLLKDFVVDEYQIAVARSRGADLVLLLVSVLREERALKRMLDATRRFGLEALVEVNNAEEMELAIRVGALFIGVNNRNLNTFEVDMSNTSKLASMIPSNVVFAALSGVTGDEDIERAHSSGCQAVLIGETLMRSKSPSRLIEQFVQVGKRRAKPLIKICGVQHEHEAWALSEQGIDMIGMVFVPTSKRNILVDRASSIAKRFMIDDDNRDAQLLHQQLISTSSLRDERKVWYSMCERRLRTLREAVRPRPLFVGVFQNASIDEMNTIASTIHLDLIQLHGDEALETPQCLIRPSIRVFSMAPKSSSRQSSTLEILNKEWHMKSEITNGAFMMLLDTKGGGSGVEFDWSIARDWITNDVRNTMIAGGLCDDNVYDAIVALDPVAVDASSRLERDQTLTPHKFVEKDLTKTKRFISEVHRAHHRLHCQ